MTECLRQIYIPTNEIDSYTFSSLWRENVYRVDFISWNINLAQTPSHCKKVFLPYCQATAAAATTTTAATTTIITNKIDNNKNNSDGDNKPACSICVAKAMLWVFYLHHYALILNCKYYQIRTSCASKNDVLYSNSSVINKQPRRATRPNLGVLSNSDQLRI